MPVTFLSCRILAEVNVLCTSHEAVQWVPLIGNIIPMKLTQQKVYYIYIYIYIYIFIYIYFYIFI